MSSLECACRAGDPDVIDVTLAVLAWPARGGGAVIGGKVLE
jgi:hypothetical protein